ncbi:MAG: class I SAM-dependent methyltransferase [Nocardiopsaceae bacterium]|nr:class I SAM-dependent methyltransferase [Nocardiopsaceae bacterium]
MTEQGRRAAAAWQDPGFARSWASGDGLGDMLEFPRRIAAAIVAADNPGAACVVDVGSGPGDLLAAFLDELGQARGIWTDASEAMLGIARERLARFGDRVEFRIVDMTELGSGVIPPGADVIATSRAAHHLGAAGLAGFYGEAAALLKPGGWLVNLDHIETGDDTWDQRLRAARSRFRSVQGGPRHPRDYPLASLGDHLAGYAAAGITDVEVAWRAFLTCLFIGRRAGQG